MQTKQRPRIKPLIPLLLCAVAVLSGWFWYDANVDRSGWKQTTGGMQYLDFYGDPLTGWQEIDGNLYYFHNDHFLATGWQTVDGITYYFDENGIRGSGWQEVDGKTYCFADDGTIRTGWVERNGRSCYLGPDGTPKSGWLEDGYALCYLDDNGFPMTGLTVVDNKTYFFEENGHMFTGWQDMDGQLRYFQDDGTLVTGFTVLDDNTYYFSEEGIQQFGWVSIGEYDYYFHPDGSMAVGPTVINGQRHYFAPQGEHVILVNPWNYLPKDLRVDLASVNSRHSVDRSCLDALNRMLKACRDAGYRPYICSSYRTQEYQQYLLDKDIEKLQKNHKLSYQKAYEKAKTSVAVPGTSEHQLGLAVDIVQEDYVVLDSSQANTPTQKWLMEHCWEYGFILRYPSGTSAITGIIYEPWHYRYVGEKVAMEIKALGITLEEYLGATTKK